jgi:hypothetical protein
MRMKMDNVFNARGVQGGCGGVGREDVVVLL